MPPRVLVVDRGVEPVGVMLVALAGRAAFAHDGDVAFDSRRAVLLVHGAGQDHSVLRAVTGLLASRGHAPLAVDLPGHGRSAGPPLRTVESMAEWAWRFLRAVGAERAPVVGHSMGALVAIEAAVQQPDGVDALVLSGVASPMAVHPDLQAAADLGDSRAVDLMTRWAHARGSRGSAGDQGWSPTTTRRLVERELPALAGDLRACSSYVAGERAPDVGCPVTVLVGGADRMTAPASGVALASRFPAGRAVVIDGAGHNLPADRPDRVAGEIDEALRTAR